jgi:hypothetical protein
MLDHTNIHIISPDPEFVVYNVFHDMVLFLLPEVKISIPQPYISKIVVTGKPP